ncbi:hypothetical protein SAMN04488581_3619 [Mycolicibacterium neoaurum]|uniref:hypothetical protein n=1 Tax=Mycolicibacterium neoaurum TaxID=1795 RepID=UPI00055DAA0B|nr:hypothetical protein [Mycolicibacterium neoaurum]SDE22827.1 hypothetical protein SAMN04488581_3619 [Mycolicibacterium neoaurum]
MVEFFYSPCGHPYDTTGTDGDLLAKQLQMMVEDFCQDMKTALTTGAFGRSSASMLDLDTNEALNAVGDDPTPANVLAACAAFNRHVVWMCPEQ